MHLPNEVRWNLAWAEARHPDLRCDALDLLVDPRVDVRRGNRQHECPLEALVFRLNRLDHCSIPSKKSLRPARLRADHSARLSPDKLCAVMVRAEGLEPPRLSTLEPKSSASTSSATRARTLLRKRLSGDRRAPQRRYSKDHRRGNRLGVSARFLSERIIK